MRWTAPGGTAIEVPGTAALNKTGFAQVNSVSCARPGNCGAGGSYTDNSGNQQAFVVSEVDGTWGTAEEVPGIAALAQGGYSDIASVWCARAGTCGAGGIYSDGSGSYQAFVVSETNGTWGTAEQVPVTAALNQGGYAYVQSVSCAPRGQLRRGRAVHRQLPAARRRSWSPRPTAPGATAEQAPGTGASTKAGTPS